jgi:hypothetical protein
MKDYYKILGIKATASPKDIHARWIELMRQFHPDRGRDGGTEDERVKEINEAYEALKHPSARAHYDLERTYLRKKRNLHLQRIILPPAILIVLLILALIYLRKPWGTPQPESTFPSARASITNVLNNLNAPNAPNDLNVLNQTDQIDELDQIVVARALIPNVLNDLNALNRPNELNHLNALNAPNDPNALNHPNALNVPNAPNEPNEINDPNETKPSPLVIEVKPSRKNPKAATLSNQRKVIKARIVPNQKNQTNQTDEMDQIDETNAIDQTNQPRVAKAETSAKVHEPAPSSNVPPAPNDLNHPNQPNAQNVPNDPNDPNELNHLSQLTPPSLIATEEEVKQFFFQYRERYNRKDIEGFLSLFSPRAVQNGMHGFDEIKTIYSGFFDQSQQLRYDIEDTKIQIYQNAVEVRGRYRIDQTAKGGRKQKVWTGDARWILLRENGDLKIRFLDFTHQESQ